MAGNNSFMTSLLALLDDDQFMKDVVNKPYPSTEQVEVTDYLSRVKEMLNLEGDQGQSKSSTLLSEERFVPLSSTINKLCCQITCEALHTNNARETIESLFEKLSSFSWGAKAVLTLSAFLVYYAENGHLAQIEESDHKLRLAAMLRGRSAYKLGFGALKNLIRVTLEFTERTVEFADSSKGLGALPTSIDTIASFYRIIVGVIGCSVAFSGMISMSDAFLGQDLSTSLGRVTESFKKQVENLREEHEERLYKEIKWLYRSRTDIAKFMARLCCTKKDSGTVYHCSKKTTVTVEELQNKNVMLLISGSDLSSDDLSTLTSIYRESTFTSSNYEIIWVPVVDVEDAAVKEQFQNKRSQMHWYSCYSIVRKAVAKFIKKHWQFKQQTKVVVLNQEGKVVNMDAMTMIRLWGSKALPFTLERGYKLWDEHRNNWLKLVVNNTVFESVEQSFESKELIFLYGSAEDSKIVTEIENYLDKIKSYVSFSFKFFNINTKREQFHSRLENCISSKMQVSTEMSDPMTQEQLKVYTSFKKQSGLAIITEGSSVIVNTNLRNLGTVLSRHEKWMGTGTNKQDFYTLFQAYYETVISKPQCHKFKIPNMVGNVPEHIKCTTPNCSLNMETVVTFKCCHGAR